MTITTATADNTLKKYYLSAVTDQLDLYTNPFLSRIRKSESNIYGKEIRKIVRAGMSGGIAAGSETDNLPVANGANYQVFTLSLKNLYGTLEISDKALRTSSNGAASFVNLLDEEMSNLVRSASYNLGRMLFGNGNGLLGKVVSASGKVVTVSDTKNFMEGMLIDLYTTMSVKQESGLIVKTVNREKNTITLDRSISASADSEFYVANSKGFELTGLGNIFSNSILYGNSRTDNAWLNPYMKTVETLTENEIQIAIDKVEENSGGKVNFIICSWGVRRALINLLSKKYTTVNTLELEGGYKAISFNGIPVVVDRFCPKGTMYLLNTDDFVLYQLCDWQWLEDEDGKVLRQVPGKPVYTATLVKYADLMCERPCGQAMLSGITEE